MLSNDVLYYVAALYGVLVGGFFPLIYLYSKLYFRKNRFGFRVMLRYLGRLFIILFLYELPVVAFIMTVERFGSQDSFTLIFSSPWYFVGFVVGLIGAIFLCRVGLRQTRKPGSDRQEAR